jgi:hypothetical protein
MAATPRSSGHAIPHMSPVPPRPDPLPPPLPLVPLCARSTWVTRAPTSGKRDPHCGHCSGPVPLPLPLPLLLLLLLAATMLLGPGVATAPAPPARRWAVSRSTSCGFGWACFAPAEDARFACAAPLEAEAEEEAAVAVWAVWADDEPRKLEKKPLRAGRGGPGHACSSGCRCRRQISCLQVAHVVLLLRRSFSLQPGAAQRGCAALAALRRAGSQPSWTCRSKVACTSSPSRKWMLLVQMGHTMARWSAAEGGGEGRRWSEGEGKEGEDFGR